MTHPYTRLYILPAPPDADNDITEGYEVGDVVHVEGGSVYDCRDNTEGAAVWEERAAGGGLPNPFALTADITPATLTASQDDYNPTGLATADVLRLSSDADRSISGLQGGADGRILVLVNVGSFNILLNNEETSSSAANRFSMGGHVAIGPKHAILLQYDATASRWRAIGTNAASLNGAPITSTLSSNLDEGHILIWSEEENFFTSQAVTDHVHAITNGSAVLGSTFSITGTAGTYQATGLSISLPGAGTFRITGNIRGALNGNAGTRWEIYVKLRNTTDGADLANSERLVVLTGTSGMQLQSTAPIDYPEFAAAGAKTIEVYATRDGAGTPSWTLSQILSDTRGRSVLSYEKIG